MICNIHDRWALHIHGISNQLHSHGASPRGRIFPLELTNELRREARQVYLPSWAPGNPLSRNFGGIFYLYWWLNPSLTEGILSQLVSIDIIAGECTVCLNAYRTAEANRNATSALGMSFQYPLFQHHRIAYPFRVQNRSTHISPIQTMISRFCYLPFIVFRYRITPAVKRNQ